MLVLEGVCVGPVRQPRLDKFSLRLPDPGVYVLRGPAGSGKSLIARIAAGRLRPRAGKVLLDGSQLYPRFGVHGGSSYFADGSAVPAAGETIEEFGVGLLRLFGAPGRAVRHLWNVLEPALGRPGSRMLTELSSGELALLELALGCACAPRMVVLDGQLNLLDGPLLHLAWELLQEVQQAQDRFVLCTANSRLLDVPAAFGHLTLSGSQPTTLVEAQAPGSAEEVVSVETAAEADVVRMHLRLASGSLVLTSGQSFTLLARSGAWYRMRLKAGLDPAVTELQQQGAEVLGIELADGGREG